MTEIATYRCTNGTCLRTLYLSKNSPVWKEGTPAHLRSLTITPQIANYVERYRSESYCGECHRVVEITSDTLCPLCAAPDLPREHIGRPCIQCSSGTFNLVHLAVH